MKHVHRITLVRADATSQIDYGALFKFLSDIIGFVMTVFARKDSGLDWGP